MPAAQRHPFESGEDRRQQQGQRHGPAADYCGHGAHHGDEGQIPQQAHGKGDENTEGDIAIDGQDSAQKRADIAAGKGRGDQRHGEEENAADQG